MSDNIHELPSTHVTRLIYVVWRADGILDFFFESEKLNAERLAKAQCGYVVPTKISNEVIR